MAEVHSLTTHRLSLEGAERLARYLEQAIIADADPGPRWPQIRALGQSLRQLSWDLAQETDRMAFQLDMTSEVEAFRISLCQLAEAFSRLGIIAQTYPSGASFHSPNSTGF